MLGWIDLGLARGLQVRVENEVGTFIEPKLHPCRLDVRHGSRLPEKQVTIRIENLGLEPYFHPAKAGARRGFSASQFFFAVHQNIGVVHVAFVAGPNFDCFDPPRFLDGQPEDEIPVVSVPSGGRTNGFSAFRTRSGGPRRQPSVNFGCDGRSAGLPSAAP